MPIITSLLDGDFYKFSMQNFVFHRFPNTEVEYTFVCRNEVDLRTVAGKIAAEIKALCELKFTADEIDFLRQQGIFQEDYLEFLKDFKLDFKNVHLSVHNGFKLKIKGKWVDTILFETPVLAIISELYCKKNREANEFIISYLSNGLLKIIPRDIKFADFGTRRRFSKDYHHDVVGQCKNYRSFVGTSNVMFAKQYNLQPVGTQAHEIFAASQMLAPSLRKSQKFILDQWLDEYNGKLGIALTDIITMDAFLRDFSYPLASAYQGCRHDSGDPYVWGNKLIKHYKKLDIDPMTKTAVFSDGLTFDSMIKINDYFKGRISVVFGIGTNLTNNVGITPANIVIKLTKVNGKPVAKISDSPGKTICDDQGYINTLKEVFGI